MAHYLTGANMRFSEFKIILEEKQQEPGYYTIGDSHATGVSQAGGKQWNNLAVNGKQANDQEVLGNVNSIPAGSVVLIAAGANDTANAAKSASMSNTKPISPSTIAGRVANLVNAVKNRNPSQIVFLLFPNGPARTSGIEKWYGGQYQQEVRSAIKNAIDVPIIDLDGKPLADGVHAVYSEYAKVAKEIVSKHPLGKTSGASAQADLPKDDKPSTKGSVIDVPSGRVGPAVADIQKVLVALGYKLPRHGVDGVRGPETSAAVREFQQDNGLTVDGDPGPETVAALNKLIVSKNIKFEKSTETDVKRQNATAYSGDNPLPEIKMDAVTKGKVGEVLNLVASKESSGYYDMMFGGKRYPEILSMTLRELHAFQQKHGARAGSSAAGRYQIMGFNTFPYAKKAGLNVDKDTFSPENQDKMGIVFLRECGLENWLAGKLSNDAFLDKIAGVWAAFADSKGNSQYAGVGHNKQGISPKVTLAALDNIQNATA